MAPNINNPGGLKNDPDEIRDGVVSDSTRFPGGFIDEQITQAGAPVQIVGKFQLNKASFIRSFDISADVQFPTEVSFRPDGSQMYVSDTGKDVIAQFSLSTGFDLASASFDLQFNVDTQTSNPSGLDFKPDGTRMYVVDRGGTRILEYSLSTDFDVSSASFDQSFDVGTQAGDPRSVTFDPSGSRMYISDEQSKFVYQYSLSTDFDVSSASFDQSFDVSTQAGDPRGVAVSPNGRQLYLAGKGSSSIFEYSLSTDFDVSSASLSRTLDVSPQDTGPVDATFKPDGSYLYVAGDQDDNVYQYSVGDIAGELG